MSVWWCGFGVCGILVRDDRDAIAEEESKTDNVMDWLVDDPEFKEFVRSKLEAMATAMSAKKVSKSKKTRSLERQETPT